MDRVACSAPVLGEQSALPTEKERMIPQREIRAPLLGKGKWMSDTKKQKKSFSSVLNAPNDFQEYLNEEDFVNGLK